MLEVVMVLLWLICGVVVVLVDGRGVVFVVSWF